MSNNILITWTSSWIWNYLALNLTPIFNIIWTWRSENRIKWINYIKWDLNKLETLENIVKSWIIFDYVVINAWVWYFDEFLNIWIEKHKETIETNLLSPVLLCYKLIENKQINKWIIFMWSIAWKKSFKFGSSYSASKFWLRWFAMQLKNEFIRLQISIINPSIVEKIDEEEKNSDSITLKNNYKTFWNYKKTKLEDILIIIKNIISWVEKRFEIDL